MYVCIYTTTGASYPPPSHGGGRGGGGNTGHGTIYSTINGLMPVSQSKFDLGTYLFVNLDRGTYRITNRAESQRFLCNFGLLKMVAAHCQLELPDHSSFVLWMTSNPCQN